MGETQRNLRWEEMTSVEFSEAVVATGGVCVIPMGCLERHGDHLPLGTDVFHSRELAERAIRQEPAVLFPPNFFGWIHDGKHRPGAVALRPELMVGLLENACEEAARNGLKKIVILNGHGGNEPFLDYFVWKRLEKPESYQVYLLRLRDWLPTPKEMAEELDNPDVGHGCEFETSIMLSSKPDLVHMGRAKALTEPLGRLTHLPPMRVAWFWYADWPDHMAGDPTSATKEKGEKLMAIGVKKVAAAIKAVREDCEMERLQTAYFRKVGAPLGAGE